jgi:hypothetical protein
MNSDEGSVDAFPHLPLTIESKARLELEMIVLDQDAEEAGEFLSRHGIGVREDTGSLQTCAEWLKRLELTEHKKHHIRYDEKGPMIDLS